MPLGTAAFSGVLRHLLAFVVAVLLPLDRAITVAAAAPAGSSDVHVGTLVAQYTFDERSPREGAPSPWIVPARFLAALHPVMVVAPPALDHGPDQPFALRLRATETKPSRDRSVEPAPVYHWSQGSVYTTLEAPPYRGRMLRVLAKVRLANLFDGRTRTSPARFWVRVDGPNPTAVPLVIEDSRNQIVAGWREVSIDVPVFGNATHIHLGLDIRAGAVDLSEVRVVDLGPSGVELPHALSDDEVDRLTVLAKLFGYVRFFHPSDGASEVDWDVLTIDTIEEVLAESQDVGEPSTPPGSGVTTGSAPATGAAHAYSPASSEELSAILRRALRTVAPTVLVGDVAAEPGADRFAPSRGPRPEGAFRFVRWQHYGFGMFAGDHPYVSNRVEVALPPLPANGRDITPRDGRSGVEVPSRFDTTIRAGQYEVPVSVPLLLYSGGNGTLPVPEASPPRGADSYRRKPYGFLPVSEDRTTRLAGVIMLWNIAQHFYPNFGYIDVDWPAILPWALRECAIAPDREAFADILAQMLVPLQDGHAGVYPFYRDDSGHVPFDVEIVDGRVWVSGSVLPQIHVGDELLAIDGSPVNARLVAIGNGVSAATAGSHRVRTLDRLLRGRIGETWRCTFGHDGQAYSIDVALENIGSVHGRIAESRRPAIADLGSGILYVDVTRIDEAAFRGTLPALAAARGIIIDCRGYPEEFGPEWLGHWLVGPARSLVWNVPVDAAPDRTARTFRVRDWGVEPRAPHIAAPTVFLTNAEAISRAETYLSIVKDAKLGTIVGSRTAGTNGNMVGFALPGGLRITMSGMAVEKRNGDTFHGVGIEPDVEVTPTVRDVRDGVDTVLERGLDVLRRR
ncbi:MAG: S41 family peptidase [Candidatus Eisenbacteria bacterium]